MTEVNLNRPQQPIHRDVYLRNVAPSSSIVIARALLTVNPAFVIRLAVRNPLDNDPHLGIMTYALSLRRPARHRYARRTVTLEPIASPCNQGSGSGLLGLGSQPASSALSPCSFAIEGAICIVMGLPIDLVRVAPSAASSAVLYTRRTSSARGTTACIAILPLLLAPAQARLDDPHCNSAPSPVRSASMPPRRPSLAQY